MIRYGTHDQSPLNVSPVSSCSARRPAMPRKTTPKPSSSDPSDPEADVPAELLERDEGLLAEVPDDEVAQLGDQLRQRRRPLRRLADAVGRRWRGRRRRCGGVGEVGADDGGAWVPSRSEPYCGAGTRASTGGESG